MSEILSNTKLKEFLRSTEVLKHLGVLLAYVILITHIINYVMIVQLFLKYIELITPKITNSCMSNKKFFL